jgi:hypothetical protein
MLEPCLSSALHGQLLLTTLICTLLCHVETDQRHLSRASHVCRVLIALLLVRRGDHSTGLHRASKLARERNVCFACLRDDRDSRMSCHMWELLSETLSKEARTGVEIQGFQ